VLGRAFETVVLPGLNSRPAFQLDLGLHNGHRGRTAISGLSEIESIPSRKSPTREVSVMQISEKSSASGFADFRKWLDE
ncbi:MAG TPA: hypothetical protein VMB70_00880, partial [Terriglobia bacterium]|nr:hypothetical protein [Terriglobia bacterium]